MAKQAINQQRIKTWSDYEMSKIVQCPKCQSFDLAAKRIVYHPVHGHVGIIDCNACYWTEERPMRYRVQRR